MVFAIRSIVVCALSLTPISFGSVANAQSSPALQASKYIRDVTQADVRDVVLPILRQGMQPRELEIVDRTEIRIVVDQRIGRVYAYEDANGTPIIEISTGFLSLVGSLIDANLTGRRFGKAELIGPYKEAVSSFLKTSRQVIRDGGTPAPPEPFNKFVGISEAQYSAFWQSREYDDQFSWWMRSALSIVLAHELGHHVFGHLDELETKSLAERRSMEDQADDFAIRVNWMLGVNPILFSEYFLIFAMVEDGLLEGSHAPSACRLEKFIHAGLTFSKGDQGFMSHVQKDRALSENLSQLEYAREQLKETCEDGEAMTETSIPGLF